MDAGVLILDGAAMSANAPEELHGLIAAAINAGDVAAYAGLHEADATAVFPTDGSIVRGRAEMRQALKPVLTLAPRIENRVIGKLERGGLALTHARWALTASESDGHVIELGGIATIVSRLQPDGSWLIALENTLSPG